MQQVQASHQQNRQNLSQAQATNNRYSDHCQAERGSEKIQNERQAAGDRYPQEAQHILQKIEQESVVRNDQIGRGNQTQMVPQTLWSGS